MAKKPSSSNQLTPEPFLEIRLHRLTPTPALITLCAGFENNKWRHDQFASHLMEWLPEFALCYSEYRAITGQNSVRQIKKAAAVVYTTDKYRKRGEFGELLLHVAIRQVYATLPAISKLYFKDAANNTVKGFDAVHVVADKNRLELWLGEAKFYEDIGKAIRDVVKELEVHTRAEYLRREFVLIGNKLDKDWPHADRLSKLIDPNTSLDKVFDSLCIPILLTYNSDAVSAYKTVCKAFLAALINESEEHHVTFTKANKLKNIVIRLFLIPMNTKALLIESLHRKLTAWQET